MKAEKTKKVPPQLGSPTTEANPFNKKKLFKFNPEKVIFRKNSSVVPDQTTSNKVAKNLDKIKEKGPYKHNSDKSLPRYIASSAKDSGMDSLEFESSFGESEGHSG